ncbi:MAG: SDR family oxidoreductase [Gemmatimonadaceae bacterium]|nr:SDR family oxidoreductase [Gemmatimonadaceae bacterium]
MSQAVEGSIALVTGANRGIGRAIVDALIEGGAKKVYAAARSISSLDALTRQHGSVIVPVELDVTKTGQIAAAALSADDVTLVVNNAGIAVDAGADFADINLEAAREQLEVNAFGTLAVTQAFAPHLKRNGGGTLVNIVSVVGLGSFPTFVGYSASKAAMHSITQASRLALAAQGTRVIGVYPGPVDTDMAREIPMEKASASSVAEQILIAIEAGTEEVYPDPIAQQLGGLYSSDPKGVERAIAAMSAGAAVA